MKTTMNAKIVIYRNKLGQTCLALVSISDNRDWTSLEENFNREYILARARGIKRVTGMTIEIDETIAQF